MPNWIKGDLKVRGTKENVKRFLLEGLDPAPIGFTAGSYYIQVICDDKWDFSIKSSTEMFYIKGTKRHFIDLEVIETYMNEWEESEEKVIILEEFIAAWAIDAEALAKISKEFEIDFKILGFEKGMCFNQDVEIIKGEIIKNEEIHFNDYNWECIRPHIGG